MELPPVTGFSYNKQNSSLSWDSIPEADNYEIKYKLSTAPSYTEAYYGSNTQCSLDLDPGTYDFTGKGSGSSGGLGVWTDPPEQIVVQ